VPVKCWAAQQPRKNKVVAAITPLIQRRRADPRPCRHRLTRARRCPERIGHRRALVGSAAVRRNFMRACIKSEPVGHERKLLTRGHLAGNLCKHVPVFSNCIWRGLKRLVLCQSALDSSRAPAGDRGYRPATPMRFQPLCRSMTRENSNMARSLPLRVPQYPATWTFTAMINLPSICR